MAIPKGGMGAKGSADVSRDRLADLLIDPREDLDVEIKNWLDLHSDNRDKATFAKAALALANHGGGFIVLGFEDGVGQPVEAEKRPAMTRYSQDVVNGVVERYCDPSFHCEVHFEANPSGSVFPVVKVPGGHRVPVRAKRSGPEGEILRQNDIYVRKPGPRSETAQTSREWDELLSRCLGNRRDDLASLMRRMLAGLDPLSQPQDAGKRLDQWADKCLRRWSEITECLPAGAAPRFPHGCYSFAYEVVGGAGSVPLEELPDILQASVVRHTGWPPFWYPTREEIAPYPFDGAVECWLGGDRHAGATNDAAHSDFWRVAPEALAYLLRGYQEDGWGTDRAGRGVQPGAVFDLTLPVWRTGEALLHAARFAETLLGRPATIRFAAQYTGLAGRSLASLANPRRYVGRDYVARDASIRRVAEVESELIGANLPEVVHQLLAPLYGLFGFFRLPTQLVVEELERMRTGRF